MMPSGLAVFRKLNVILIKFSEMCQAVSLTALGLPTQLTRVEGENTRLRHYLARLHRATLCYSKSTQMLKYSVRLLMHYLRFKRVPIFS